MSGTRSMQRGLQLPLDIVPPDFSGINVRNAINEKGPVGPFRACAAQFFRYHRSSFDHSGFL